MAAAKKKPAPKKEVVAEEKTPKEPLLFQPLTEDGDYPALVIFVGPSDSTIGVVKEEGGTPAHGGYYSKTFESMINAVDKCLFAYKISSTQRNKLRMPEFLGLLEEHKEFMEKVIRGEVKKCLSKT